MGIQNEYRIEYYCEEFGAREETVFKTANNNLRRLLSSFIEFLNEKYSTKFKIVCFLGNNPNKNIIFLTELITKEKKRMEE